LKGGYLRRKTSKHHRLPRSICKRFGVVDKDDPRNLILKTPEEHEAYHILFGNKSPEEVVEHLFLEWLPPPSVFNPDFIKDIHLRAYFESIWKDRLRSENLRSSKMFTCQNCQGKLVEVDRQGKLIIFNCQECGNFECYSCMFCFKPAKIPVDLDENFYICYFCLQKIVKKKLKIPKRFKKYKSLFFKIFHNRNNKKGD